jgi:hypothetical protein
MQMVRSLLPQGLVWLARLWLPLGSNNYRAYTINLSTPSKNAAAPYSYQVLMLHSQRTNSADHTVCVQKNSRSQFVINDGLTNNQPIDFIVFDTV